MKECITCKQSKALEDFPVRPDSPDGHRNECMVCKSAYLAKYRSEPRKQKEVLPEGMKRCYVCKAVKATIEFSKSKVTRDGLRSECKVCKREASRKERETKPEYFKKYKEEHKETISLQIKEWRQKHKKDIYLYQAEKIKNNLLQRISHILRTRFKAAFRKQCKTGSAVRNLGCSMEELRAYLESKFQPGMSWENYGLYGWHIDHIAPLSRFDLTDIEQVKLACHYTNLQPLWAKDNLSKGAKLPKDKGD